MIFKVVRVALGRRSCEGFGRPFLVHVNEREAVRVSLHLVSNLLERPLTPVLIVVDLNELWRVVVDLGVGPATWSEPHHMPVQLCAGS